MPQLVLSNVVDAETWATAQGVPWTLAAGTGVRTVTISIAFKFPFVRDPVVSTAISTFDASGAAIEIGVSADIVEATGFQLTFLAGELTTVRWLRGLWIAIGDLP